MKITRHTLAGDGIEFVPSPNFSSKVIIPKFIVMHYTASFKDSGSIAWMANPKSRVSAHIVIGKSGKITQMVDLDKKAWHAGPSSSQGYTGLNSHSIGIELVNPGPLTVRGQDVYDSYGRELPIFVRDLVLDEGCYWLPYAKKQLDALQEVVIALRDTYPTIFDCVGHEEIDTRGVKRDPGPLFPMARYDDLVSSREQDERVYQTITSLRLRRGPSTSTTAIMVLTPDSKVKEIRRNGKWMFVKFAGHSGYLHTDYLKRI